MAQEISSMANNETPTPEVIKAQQAVNKVLFDSGVSFREGLIAYEDKRLSDAGEKFNK